MGSPSEWIVPPTFSASQFMSARHLNIMEHDLATLFGVNFSPAMCFYGIQYQTGGDPDVVQQSARYRLEHQFDNFYYRFGVKVLNAADTASFLMTIAPQGGTASDLISGSSGSTSTEVFSGSKDISSYGLTTGCVYIIRAFSRRITGGTDQVVGQLDYMFEAAGSTGWTTPPAFTSTCMAAASDLNIWRDDLNWIKDRNVLVNHSFGFLEAQTGDTQPSTKRLFHGYIKHTGSLLHFRFGQRVVTEPTKSPVGVEEVWLDINGSTAACTTCNGTNDWKYTTGSFNLAGKGLTAGNFYEVFLSAKNTDSYAGQVGTRVEYIYETQTISPSGWTPTRTYKHGDQPNSASLKAISDNLTSLHDERRDMQWPTRDNYTKGGAVIPSETGYGGVSIIHRAPWLHFLGSGELTYGSNSAQFTDAQTASPGTVWGSMNLDELSWLPRGGLFTVSGEDLICAYESYDP